MSQPMAYKDFLFKVEMSPTSLEERAQEQEGFDTSFQIQFPLRDETLSRVIHI